MVLRLRVSAPAGIWATALTLSRSFDQSVMGCCAARAARARVTLAKTDTGAERCSRGNEVHDMTATVRTMDSKIGPLLLAASSEGLIRVAFASEDLDQVESELTEQHGSLSGADSDADAVLDRAQEQLNAYLEGSRRTFDLPISFGAISDFRRSVLGVIAAIPYGKTATYGELAVAVGAPGSARAVGTACATNPLPLVVPCHRVVRSDGSDGQYLGGVQIKATLLALEHG